MSALGISWGMTPVLPGGLDAVDFAGAATAGPARFSAEDWCAGGVAGGVIVVEGVWAQPAMRAATNPRIPIVEFNFCKQFTWLASRQVGLETTSPKRVQPCFRIAG